MARFFIDRPIFAWVIAIVIMLAGALSIQQLPVSQYPSIAPPAIVINAKYPGASAKAVEDSVTQIIEQKLTGLDGLLYMKSTSDAYGNASTTLTFSADTDPDIAQVQVQNKMQTALPLLPQAVQQQGVTVAKSAMNFLMVVGFVSEDGSMDGTDLSDFLVSSVQDPLSRVDGVGEVQPPPPPPPTGNNFFPLWRQDISHFTLVFDQTQGDVKPAPSGDGYYTVKIDVPGSFNDDLDASLANVLAALRVVDSNVTASSPLIGAVIKGGLQITSYFAYGSHDSNGSTSDTLPADLGFILRGDNSVEYPTSAIDAAYDYDTLMLLGVSSTPG